VAAFFCCENPLVSKDFTPSLSSAALSQVAACNASWTPSVPRFVSNAVAGCGTGREAASVALTFPDARVTAIDISETSLRYARRQCAEVGRQISNLRYWTFIKSVNSANNSMPSTAAAYCIIFQIRSKAGPL
jgi:SAM-dependent methyltransferase